MNSNDLDSIRGHLTNILGREVTKEDVNDLIEELFPEKKLDPVVDKDGKIENFMPKINGKSFRCNCGANVFHKPDKTRPDLFECNGCGQWYDSE